VNQYSWTNISSMLYVEQPVGVGYSQGTPDITDEDGLAAELVGFFQQFLEVFKEMKGKKFWLSGESVRVVHFMRELELIEGPVCWPICPVFVHIRLHASSFPLTFLFADIANYIYENPSQLDLDLQGIWISDRAPLPPFLPSPH
jgi:carboxypeptidase D